MLDRLRRPWFLVLLTVMLVAGLALVVIGGRTSAKDRFTGQAAEICRDSKSSIQEASDAILGTSPSPGAIARFLGGAFTAELRDRMARLRALDLPEDDADEIGALFSDYEAVIETIRADPAAYADQRADPFTDVDARFDAYGLHECGSARIGT
ncbi:MAG: hypothetical protein ACRD0U_00205 [Acidimicrobiales bacterium]